MTFTDAELDIIGCVAAGFSNKEIAAITGFTPASVCVRLTQIYEKAAITESAKRVVLAVRSVTEGWMNGQGN